MTRITKTAFALLSFLFCGAWLVGQARRPEVGVNSAHVKAGENVEFIVKLNEPTNVPGASIRYRIRHVGEQWWVQSSVPLYIGQNEVKITFQVPFDSPGGQYQLDSLEFAFPSARSVPIPSGPVEFQVIPNAGFTFPKSASVLINPSQVQMLRSEAIALNRRLQELKARVAQVQRSNRALTLELNRSIASELAILQKTSTSFQELGGTAESQALAAVFFADLALTYKNTSQSLRAMGSGQKVARFEIISKSYLSSFQSESSSGITPVTAAAVYRSMEQTQLAYGMVAQTGDLSFTLKVISNPSGARVSYARRGDPFKTHADPTSTTIEYLPLAIWIIRLHKDHFVDEEREFNPFTQQERTIEISMRAR